MSILTYTSSERAVERIGEEYPPCCGRAPMVLTWPKKELTSIICVSPACPNHEGVLCYSGDAMARWSQVRTPTAQEQRAKLIEETRAVLTHAGQRYALTWEECPWCGG